MENKITAKQFAQLEADCELITKTYPRLKQELDGSRILISGGTGFFGKWILSYLRHLIVQHGLKLDVDIITRNPALFLKQFPSLDVESFYYHQTDVRTFTLKNNIDLAIHAATEASAKLNSENPAEMFDVNIAGTKNFLKNCAELGAKRVLITSSGAVYGKQSPATLKQPEDVQAGPEPFNKTSAYAEGKRVSEFLGALHASKHNQMVNIARCYAFLGPFLPLDTHFAAGNFIKDCLHRRSIRIKGDGSTVRSYQHPVDLVGWLFTILLRGSGDAYNVGSERGVSIAELAHFVSAINQKLQGTNTPVHIEGKPNPLTPVDRYVPSTQKVSAKLKLTETISLEDAISKTLDWHTITD